MNNDLKQVKGQLTRLHRVLRETRALKPQSQTAFEALNIEGIKAFGEERKKVKCKYATAVYRHAQLLALEARLLKQIYALKIQKEKLEKLVGKGQELP